MKLKFLKALIMLMAFHSLNTSAAIALDRTRIIFDGANNSVSMNLTNKNQNLPYLAEGWLETEKGEKINSPFIVLPPIQRIEAGDKSIVKIQANPTVAKLPQDRESLYYFNMREIPPRSKTPNTLQIALQTRIKMFYRPAAVAEMSKKKKDWQKQIILQENGSGYIITNPTPYYVTLTNFRSSKNGKNVSDIKALMIAPKDSAQLNIKSSILGPHPVMEYIDDYGGRPVVTFDCQGGTCHATSKS